MILRLSPKNYEAKNLARRIVSDLYGNERGEKKFEDFAAALRFAWGELRSSDSSLINSPQLLLAASWSHAGALYQIFRENGMLPGEISRMLSRRVSSVVFNATFDAPEIWSDCSHPRKLSRKRFLTVAATALLADIDGGVLSEIGFSESVKSETFIRSGEDVSFPAFPLLLDATLYQNHLQSFLGERGYDALAPIIGDESIEILKPENLKETVAHYLKEMAENPTQNVNWGWIHAVVGDLPIYPDLAEDCRRALGKFEPAVLENENLQGFLLSFQGAVYQAVYLQDKELLERLDGQLREILTRELAVEEDIKIKAEKVSIILGIGLILSTAPADPSQTCARFAVLIKELAASNPSLGKFVGNFLSEEIWRLPFDSRDEWWQLRLFLQATNESLATK